MSNSPLIPKEKLSAYQRWELHTFDTPANDGGTDAEAAKVHHIHKHAYEAGRADGLRDSAAKASRDGARFTTLLADIRRQSLEFNQRIADDVLAFALDLARHMVRQALDVRPELIIPVVHDALARIPQPAAQASIALNPADAALIREHGGEPLAGSDWKIIEDPAIARGGCVLQTTASQVDATVETRWQRLTAALGHDTQWLKPAHASTVEE
jgi:flagellar assembly protein FliH